MDIVVLAGGISTERDVSLVSGSLIAKALKENGHRVILLDVYLGFGKEGEDVAQLFDRAEDFPLELRAVGESAPDLTEVKKMRSADTQGFFGPNVLAACRQADIVFIGLHGDVGENGKVQAVFDLNEIRYTGTGYLGSALAMHKGISRMLFAKNGIPVAKGRMIKKGMEIAVDDIGFPCVVKPCSGGSSVGVSIAQNEEEYEKAVKEAFCYEDEIVVEKYVHGREFSVGVIDGKALPLIEIAPISGFYDYKNKYQAGSTIETCPAMLDRETSERMQRFAEMAAAALELMTYARMDFILGDDGEMVCLECNTLPGMTPGHRDEL